MHERGSTDQRLAQVERVLVLGAGLAELSAARALTQLGYQVVVLEARERVGGRCWTVDNVELGAQWIHSTEGNPIRILARELGLATLFVGGDSTYVGGWEQLTLLGRGGLELDVEDKQRSILAADAFDEPFWPRSVRVRLHRTSRRRIAHVHPEPVEDSALPTLSAGVPRIDARALLDETV